MTPSSAYPDHEYLNKQNGYYHRRYPDENDRLSCGFIAQSQIDRRRSESLSSRTGRTLEKSGCAAGQMLP